MTRDEFIKKQIEYNIKREKANYKKLKKSDERYKKELVKIYKQSKDDITKKIEAMYTRYGLSEGIPIEEAKKKVSKFDVEAFKEKADEFIKMKDTSPRAKERMAIYNLKQRVSALELMKHEINLETMKLADKEEKKLIDRLNDTAIAELERQAGYHNMSKAIRKNIVKNVDELINGSHKVAKFSESIWINQAELSNRLSTGLTRAILTRESPKVWSRELRSLVRENMGDTGKLNAVYAANRLAITEDSRVMNATALKSFKEMGYEKYIWVCEPGACPICLPLNGEIITIKDNIAGKDLPPMHPHCKCSIAAYYEYNPDDDWSLFDFI